MQTQPVEFLRVLPLPTVAELLSVSLRILRALVACGSIPADTIQLGTDKLRAAWTPSA